jgi:hypothetical protein
MDLLIIAILLATAILAVVLLRGRNRYSPEAGGSDSVIAVPSRVRLRKNQPSIIDLDPQTRFSDTMRHKQYRLLNDAEQILYCRLCEAMPNMQVFAQVGVAQLAQLRGRQEAKRLSRMAGRGVDFIVCDGEFAIVAAIELAWPTGSESGNSPEEEKRHALQSLGIPLIVYRPNQLPDAESLSREIASAIVRRNRLEAERNKKA